MSVRLRRIPSPPQRSRVLVVGDVILDEYLHGRVDRLSPEAPVPVLDSVASTFALGGAANVAHNLAALGAEVRLAGVIGDDPAGEQLRALLTAAGIDHSGLVVVPGRPTPHKTRVVAHSQQVVRIDRERRTALDPASTASLEEKLRLALETELDGVLISDYDKGTITPTIATNLITAAHWRGLDVIADPKGADFSRYRGARLLTPNLRELGIAAGVDLKDPATPEVERAAARLLALCEAEALLVTCGKAGMILFERGGEAVHVPAEAREVFDITGAGDTVVAVLGMAVFAGEALLASARLANTAAGIVVGIPGTATVARAELVARLITDGVSGGKIVGREALLPVLAAVRAAGQRIVFTNGCFELLHAGHVAYLEAARAHGDLLVVGLNSDGSVRRLKGEQRPLVPAAQRAAVLAGLASVSFVTLFDEETPAELIAALVPDVLVKGADYAPEEVVGRETVEAGGGRLELIELVEGISTTEIIETIRRRFGRA